MLRQPRKARQKRLALAIFPPTAKPAQFSKGARSMPVPGTMGKILMVDLDTQEISVETPSDDVYLKQYSYPHAADSARPPK